ncbi:MAG: hypothetical protein HEQ23_02900 [Tepidisphaera sp.]
MTKILGCIVVLIAVFKFAQRMLAGDALHAAMTNSIIEKSMSVSFWMCVEAAAIWWIIGEVLIKVRHKTTTQCGSFEGQGGDMPWRGAGSGVAWISAALCGFLVVLLILSAGSQNHGLFWARGHDYWMSQPANFREGLRGKVWFIINCIEAAMILIVAASIYMVIPHLHEIAVTMLKRMSGAADADRVFCKERESWALWSVMGTIGLPVVVMSLYYVLWHNMPDLSIVKQPASTAQEQAEKMFSRTKNLPAIGSMIGYSMPLFVASCWFAIKLYIAGILAPGNFVLNLLGVKPPPIHSRRE